MSRRGWFCAVLMVLAAARLGAQPSVADSGAPAPDLEIVALQTTGPGRVGDCNSVVARLRNAGAAATEEAPAVRLDVTGTTRFTRTQRIGSPLAPGATVEVWFESVPIEGGLVSQLEAIADPEGSVRESNEDNNTRRVAREPRVACGDPAPEAAGLELRVRVDMRTVGEASGHRTPLYGAEVSVASPLGAGAVLGTGVTGADGRLSLTIAAENRAPVLRVTASAPGCEPSTGLATPTPGAAGQVLHVDLALECTGTSATSALGEAGALEIEAALPGLLRLDDGPPEEVTFGSRVTVRRPGDRVRIRWSSANGTVLHDATLEVPLHGARAVVIDAPAHRVAFADHGESPRSTPAAGEQRTADVVEDLRSGLLWTVGAAATSDYAEARTTCDRLDRGGTLEWRLPDIDELAFVLDAGTDVFPRASNCCMWSTTEHAGLRLTFYVEGGHIYGRRAEESGIGALCVAGDAYEVDPLLVPQRYHDRLPAPRSFRPRG